MSYFYAFNSVGNNLKWRPRLKIFKSGALTYDPKTGEAYSYDWCFLKRINGKLVFNAYCYSNTTTRHQWEVRAFLKQKRIKIDVEVKIIKSLNSDDAGPMALAQEIETALADDQGRAPDLDCARKIAKAFKLKINSAMVSEIATKMEIKACEVFLRRSVLRQEEKMREFLERLGAPVYSGPAIESESTDSTQPDDSNPFAGVFPCAA